MLERVENYENESKIMEKDESRGYWENFIWLEI